MVRIIIQKCFLALLTAIGLSASFQALAESSCKINKDKVAALYQVTTKEIKSGKILRKEQINFWRLDKQVAYEYVNRNTTEVWNLVSNGQVRPVRYFDRKKRAIEYQPLDVNQGKGDRDWSTKFQIVNQNQLDKMQLVSESKAGCENRRIYADGKGREVNWNSVLLIPNSIKITTNAYILEWSLLETIENPAKIKSTFESRINFQMTDFADIGDNETDPFLTQWEGKPFNSQFSPLSVVTQQPMAAHSGHRH